MKFLASILVLATAVAVSPVASAQFTVGGAGGPIPVMDTGTSGDRCDILPNDLASFPAGAAVPAGAMSITSVELVGLAHTWVGDVQVVLRDPNGVGYTLISRLNPDMGVCTGFGDSSDFGGDYRIVGQCDAGGDLLAEAVAGGATDAIASGDYHQFYGVWVDGSAGVNNDDLSAIAPIEGVWTLEVFDGGGGDLGSLVEWRMNGTTIGGDTQSGGGGDIPLADTGTSGDRCTILPNDSNVFPLTMPLSAGGSIESVTLTGLAHTWVGDVQIVLVDPNGVGYNLCARINPDMGVCTGFGDSSDFGGDYTFVSAGGGGDLLAEAVAGGATDAIASGDYDQFYGVWVDGSAGVFNTDIGSIPVAPGTWELLVLDGGGGDLGTLDSWSMTTSSISESVCDGEANSTGAAASFSVSGSTSIASDDLVLNVGNLPMGAFGFFIVGDACTNVPMAGSGQGTMCVGGDVRRGVGNSIVSSGMTGAVSLAADLANIPTTGFGNPSGVAATPDQRLFIQFWYRDAAGGVATSNLSNALLVVPTM